MCNDYDSGAKVQKRTVEDQEAGRWHKSKHAYFEAGEV
jgi:hypothetical protein